MWFVNNFKVEFSKVREVFIDATYQTSKLNMHLYSIVAEELGYGVPLAFMIMEIHPKEDETRPKVKAEALECNRHFYSEAKKLGIDPEFVHTDKDFSELTAVPIHHARG